MLFAHLPSGYVLSYVNEKLVWKEKLSRQFRKQLVLLSTFGGAFPDVDTLPFLTDGRALAMHRTFVTHTPFLYVVLSVVVYSFAQTFGNKLRKKILMWWSAFVAGAMLHLLTDSVIFGIRWLYPLTNKYYGLIKDPFVSVSFADWVIEYATSIYFLPETFFFLAAAWLFFVSKFARG